MATLSVNVAANIVSPSFDFSNLYPRKLSFKTGGTITGILGIIMMPWKLLQDYGTYIFGWLVGYSAFLGPIAGILICDYWVLRRRRLKLDDLYKPDGQYSYSDPGSPVARVAMRALNMTAFSLLLLGLARGVPAIHSLWVSYPGFVLAAIVSVAFLATLFFTWLFFLKGFNWRASFALVLGITTALIGCVVECLRPLYNYAWFVGFAVAFGAYYFIMLPYCRPKSFDVETA